MLEKEGGLVLPALRFDFLNPIGIDWPGTRTRFSPDNGPMYIPQTDKTNWTKQRLKRDKSDSGGNRSQFIYAVGVATTLH